MLLKTPPNEAEGYIDDNEHDDNLFKNFCPLLTSSDDENSKVDDEIEEDRMMTIQWIFVRSNMKINKNAKCLKAILISRKETKGAKPKYSSVKEESTSFEEPFEFSRTGWSSEIPNENPVERERRLCEEDELIFYEEEEEEEEEEEMVWTLADVAQLDLRCVDSFKIFTQFIWHMFIFGYKLKLRLFPDILRQDIKLVA
ncbi:hypothetical protein Anas_01975 [Armadillidium nasatum]|uniref:Uncharacterized protein n=1 Tax=Armadillidium nasatum TaxID=96803 RepID=A0A5N5TNK1_9CRUS|nr:hypothetical protein Anas_01975 [Armadillidium nasatum]